MLNLVIDIFDIIMAFGCLLIFPPAALLRVFMSTSSSLIHFVGSVVFPLVLFVVLSVTCSAVLGQGWRMGFLGMLHMEVFNQRLEEVCSFPGCVARRTACTWQR